jgi:lysozyme family protein
MKENFDASLKAILHHEGGYVNHKDDPGGRTNLGVTQKVWEEWLGHPVDEQAMRALTPEIVAPMYKSRYWDKIKGDELPAGLDYAVFDAAINSGPSRAVKWLQECVNVKADGGIGPKTLAAVAKFDPAELVAAYAKCRLNFLQHLPHWSTFGKGWSRRVAEVQTAATSMTA